MNNKEKPPSEIQNDLIKDGKVDVLVLGKLWLKKKNILSFSIGFLTAVVFLMILARVFHLGIIEKVDFPPNLALIISEYAFIISGTHLFISGYPFFILGYGWSAPIIAGLAAIPIRDFIFREKNGLSYPRQHASASLRLLRGQLWC